ncbi:hypothetical protein M427DRAFT_30483 [Gonapodya prolifera JEL478]|uniref:Uncharacterized protein n=1 Tax=Gonapodya prolifera (strain JEL478) TaxID=1344416 RepID=A0A139AKM2_GONPJ|nr:hypothetical protein M427DRAFT_30483 [Gonapodya prolifera JEL478]|eukprot:KXS17341.1 hypothetical protein M427DRAFT_30483 [Gonapodya prolifera JEL478]
MASSAVKPAQTVTTETASVTFLVTRGLKPERAKAFYGQGPPFGSFVNVFRELETNGGVLASSSYDSATFLPKAGGLVEVILGAYRGHPNLVLRPDDVWLAITS